MYPVAFVEPHCKIFTNLTSRKIREGILRKCYGLLMFPNLLGNTDSALSRYIDILQHTDSRSQWPRALRRGSSAARLLRLWVRIPPGGMDVLSVVSVVCCQVEVSATS